LTTLTQEYPIYEPPHDPLPSHLEARGWSAEVVDWCWLDCTNGGHLKRLGKASLQMVIVLCSDHILELEESSTHGYSQAEPPGASVLDAWPWVAVADSPFAPN
jgi:hypothetical protein